MAKQANPLKNVPVRIVGNRSLLSSAQRLADETDGMTDEEIDQWLATGERPGDEPEQESRTALVASAITSLAPSSFATFIVLRDAIPADVRERVLAGHRLCMIARLPHKTWIEPTRQALSVALEEIAVDAGGEVDASVTVRGIDRRYNRIPVFPIDDIVVALTRMHVVVPLLPGEQIGCTLPALADLELALDPTAETLLVAVRRRFPDAPAWPEHLAPKHVRPESLDLACKRGASADHAFVLLDRLVAAATEEEERRAAERAETEAKEAEIEARKKSKASSSTQILRPTSPRLEDLHGYGEAALWAQDLVRDLADYAAGNLAWSDVDSGCLLYGPPGTGKTTFAGALAASAGLPFVATSYGDWQSQGEAHGGTLVKAMRQRFADASALSPCILFIDEIDAFPARGKGGRNEEWWRPITTSLLECLDGTVRREGLVVLAACNDPSGLDPALVRSGRLDRHFEVGLPDESALAKIFAHHLPGADVSAFEQAATVLAGSCSGADVARIAREARRAARREQRDLVADDLLAIAMPPDTRSPANRKLVAVHEAGHAMAMLVHGRVPDSLSIVASASGSHGCVMAAIDFGMGRLAEIEAEIVVLLAGRASEEIILGEPSAGAGQDLERATILVKQIVGTCGLGGRLLHDSQVSGSDVEARLREIYARTLRLVTEHRAAVEALAELALEKRVLSRRALAEFAEEFGFGGVR